MDQQTNRKQPVPRTPEAFATVGKLHICWDSFGDAKNPALFLISGMGAQMVSWDDEFCEMLAARGFWVIRFDNRDVGRSSHLDELGTPNVKWAMMQAMWYFQVRAPYTLEDMADDLVGLMDELGIEKAHLVGISMGGAIAQTAAIEDAERVLSLTSIGSTTGAPDLPRPDSLIVQSILRTAPFELDDYIEYYVDNWKILRAGKFPEEETRDRERAVRIHRRGLNPVGGARHLMAILASGSRRSALRRVKAPTQVIHGDIDPLVPFAAGLDTADSVPGAQMLIAEDMGHSIPEPFWPLITKTIAENAARASA